MSVVGAPVVRRIIEVSSTAASPDQLLDSVGLSSGVPSRDWSREAINEDAYYGLLELAAAEDDHALPFRYAERLRADDFGALGLAMKTACTVRDSLLRLVRYILVLSDTLEYELRDEVGGAVFVLSRPSHRRGARLANECALAAVTAILREVTASNVTPVAVSFRHPRPPSHSPHLEYFGCPIRFEDRINGLHFSSATLESTLRLADDGLSAFVLAELDGLRDEREGRTLVARVHGAIEDSLPNGRPRKSQIARRLGMSERTLHRRLAEQGETFASIASRAQRESAEALLEGGHVSIAEVAFLTGFSDQSAFTRAFKSWTGLTPLKYRESVSV